MSAPHANRILLFLVAAAASVGTLVMISLIRADISGFRAQTTGDNVVYVTPEQAAEGVIIQANTHTVVRCPADQSSFPIGHLAGRSWAYAYAHETSEWNGMYVFSQDLVAENPSLADREQFSQFEPGGYYYIWVSVEHGFRCGAGLHERPIY